MKTAKAAAVDPAAPAEPEVSAPTEPLPPDAHAGHGGLYEIRDGRRVLIERTRATPPKNGDARNG